MTPHGLSTHSLSRLPSCPLAEARQRLVDATGVEAPVATHDGLIWPVQRRLMCSHDAIRVRLAEDVIAIWRDTEGHLQDGDLIRLGWEEDDNGSRRLAWRVRRHLAAAVALARAARPDLVGMALRTIRKAA
jgi:hypothetical protein